MKVYINKKEYEYKDGVTYFEIAKDFQADYDQDILLVKTQYRFAELQSIAQEGDDISFIFFTDKQGYMAYAHTAVFILLKALYEHFSPNENYNYELEFRLGDGYYFSVRNRENKDIVVKKDIDSIKKIFGDIVERKISVNKSSYPRKDAIEIFKSYDIVQKVSLLKYVLKNNINVYTIEDFPGYFYGYLLYDTGYIKDFEIKFYKGGLLLLIPNQIRPGIIRKEKKLDNLFSAQIKSADWSKSLSANCVGLLNDKIAQGEFNNLVLMQEAYQERQIGNIAQYIYDHKEKIILIACPSSSGKTTFSHRLSTHLKALGRTTHPIAVDNFFVNRVDTKKDENGEYEFESIDNVDLKLFADTINALTDGKSVVLPRYDFKKGEKIFDGPPYEIDDDDVLVIEGIHCLNNKLYDKLICKNKFKIYISDLTPISIDEHNRISTSDCRLIRRIVRDNRTRGYGVADTIKMWKKVRKGEEENIFPFQENADVFFNSALIYELAVLKIYVEPLLFNVPQDAPEYEEAQELLRFLSYFLGAPSDEVPKSSILREFIGGNVFDVI